MAILLMNSTSDDAVNNTIKRAAQAQLAGKEGSNYKVKVDLGNRIIMCDAVRDGQDWRVTLVSDTPLRR